MKMHAVSEDEERVQTPTREVLQLDLSEISRSARSGTKHCSRIACWKQAAGNGGRGHGQLSSPWILQCLLVSVLVLVPLWFTDVLPQQQFVPFLVAPSPPPPPPPPAAPGFRYRQSRENRDRHRQWAAADA